MRRITLSAAALWLLVGSSAAALDAFERHTTQILKQAARQGKPVEELTQQAAGDLKPLDKRNPLPCIAVRTAEGNWSKARIDWGFRRDKAGKLVPVLLVERFVTYDGQRLDNAVAAGHDVMLFDGFEFDLELGQVVPPGHGGDLVFAKRALRPLEGTELYPLDGSLIPPDDTPPQQVPDAGRQGVLPRDFIGTWKVDGDGRWKGTLELNVAADGAADGRYFSDETQSVYPVKGHVSRLPHRIHLDIELVGLVQVVEAYLWTSDKSKMAGTLLVNEQRFGFLAVRDEPAPPKTPQPESSGEGEGAVRQE